MTLSISDDAKLNLDFLNRIQNKTNIDSRNRKLNHTETDKRTQKTPTTTSMKLEALDHL